MSPHAPVNRTLAFRVTTDVGNAFEALAAEYGRRPSDLLRELVDAFVQGRMHLDPPKGHKDLYTPGS